MNNELIESERRKNLHQQEMTFNAHCQKFDNSSKIIHCGFDKGELLCACTGTLCEGICRTTHLHRPRYANPIKPKNKEAVPVRKQWAEKCPEAYEKS